MAESSAIEWTDATVNFWWGCTKVGPGCDHCYAETWNAFRGTGLWGPGTPRRQIVSAEKTMRKLNRLHEAFFVEHGRRRRVFVQSMSDTFDNEVDQPWRDTLFAEVESAQNCDIQLLTKRISNVPKMVPAHWLSGNWPRHVGLMITVVNQGEADRDVPRLIMLKQHLHIPWVGLSCEPLLGPLDLRTWLPHLDWVIAGGESGKVARIMQWDWPRIIRDQCSRANTPFLFKQWGEWVDYQDVSSGFKNCSRFDRLGNVTEARARLHPPYKNGFIMPEGDVPWHGRMMRVGKKLAGRHIDGRTHDEFPEVRI